MGRFFSSNEVNPAVVSQVDAEAGTATDERTWTAQRVAQAIAALASSEDWAATSRWDEGRVSVTSSTTMLGEGVFPGAITETDNASARDCDTDGTYFQQQNLGVTNNYAACRTTQFIELQSDPELVIPLKIDSWADIRWFCGFSSLASDIVVNSDDPASEMVGLQFSTDRSDTEFRTCEDDGTQALGVMTGNPVPTGGTYYRVRIKISGNGTLATITLEGNDGTTLGTAALNTRLPTSTTQLAVYHGLQTRGNSVKTLQQYQWKLRVNGAL